jgi:phasin family protein
MNMALTPDQILAAHKANLETLLGLTNKAFEGVEKLVELNVAATRAALSDVSANTSAVLDAKNAQDLMSVQSGLLQPMAEKTAAYSRHLYEIAAATSLEFSKAFENKAVEAQSKFNEFVDTAAKNAPAGSESAVAVMKTAVAAANNAYDSVQKAVKQAGEVAETNFNTITNNAVKAAGNVSATTAKRR